MDIEKIKEVIFSPKPLRKDFKFIVQSSGKYVDFASFINEVIDFQGSEVDPEIYGNLVDKQTPPQKENKFNSKNM